MELFLAKLSRGKYKDVILANFLLTLNIFTS